MKNTDDQDYEAKKGVFGTVKAPGSDPDGREGQRATCPVESADMDALLAYLQNLERIAAAVEQGVEVAAIMDWERVAEAGAHGKSLLVCLHCLLVHTFEGAEDDGVSREEVLLGLAGQNERPAGAHVFTTESCPLCSPDDSNPQVGIVFQPRT